MHCSLNLRLSHDGSNQYLFKSTEASGVNQRHTDINASEKWPWTS